MPQDTTSAQPPPRVRINGTVSERGARCHIWAKAQSSAVPATLTVSVGTAEPVALTVPETAEFQFRDVELAASGAVGITFDPAHTMVSAAYVFQPETVLDEGITVLHVDSANRVPRPAHAYHFRPPFGWMNDPNGFSRFGSRAHLFYQHYPHGLRWNTMHWGHAASDDYLRWRHLPLFLLPSPTLSATADGRGGAFSGSAVSRRDEPGVRVFFTEHLADRTPEEQMQFTAVSHDGIGAGQPDLILPARPDDLELTSDFRDPFVVRGPDNRWKMLLGSRDPLGGVILLYDTDDDTAAAGWTFRGVLHREGRFGTTVAECPCLVPLGQPVDDPQTRWALIFSLLESREPATGRRNLSTITVGRFDGVSFTPEFEQELDFGTDAYAFQALPDEEGPIGIAWLANWIDVDRTRDFSSAMTLPRRLVLGNGVLSTPPIETVATLRRGCLDDRRLAAGEGVELANDAVEIEIEMAAAGLPFDLHLDHPGLDLGVQQNGDGLSIRFRTADGGPAPRYLAAGAAARSVRIFLDAGSIEVFADGGRWTGTKRLPGGAVTGSARLLAPPGSVAAATIWQLSLDR